MLFLTGISFRGASAFVDLFDLLCQLCSVSVPGISRKGFPCFL